MTAAARKNGREERKGAKRRRERERESERKNSYVCIGVYRKTEGRRKKNSRKRSGASAEQKGTKLISEALTNYFLRKGVGYLQLSTRSLPARSPVCPSVRCSISLPLRGSRSNPLPPPSFVNQLVGWANTLMKKNINRPDTGRPLLKGGGAAAAAGAGGRDKGGGGNVSAKGGRQKFQIHPFEHRRHVKGNTRRGALAPL